jgi:hypothetical protein
MAKTPEKNQKEEAFRFATTVFLIGTIVSLISALVCFEDDIVDLGILLVVMSILLLIITVWTYYHSFYPVLSGFIIALFLILLTIYYHPDDTINAKYRSGPLRYMIIALVLISRALFIGFKEWRMQIRNKRESKA